MRAADFFWALLIYLALALLGADLIASGGCAARRCAFDVGCYESSE